MQLTRDASLVIGTRTVRSFSDGFISVLLASYLSRLGFSGVRIGAITTATLLGTAAATIAAGAVADRFGRRRLLILAAVVAAGTGFAFASSSAFIPILFIALIGTLNPSFSDVSMFLPIEQAILPETVDARDRTALFARYNLLAVLAAASGALFAGVPSLLERWFGWDLTDAMRAMFVLYGLLALVNLAAYRALSPRIEANRVETHAPLHRSRNIVFGLSSLFAIDAFAGGFIVQSMLALWMFERFGLSVDQAGLIFFVAGIFTAFSFLVAARVAERFGLINTMVFTHLPSNVLLILVALMPNLWLAVVMLLARQSLSQMDVPTRQSYVMAVVDPDERAAAASVTGVSRSLASSGSPVMAGALLGATSFGWPLIIAGTLKSAYDLLLLRQFRSVKPAEEIVAVPKG
ncbi:MAG TPA: MFS transporter [Dehalococcoidia bacterium]|jgi:MFS family permease|nr:MFS transporter [Dehalococcoidia bacterium]